MLLCVCPTVFECCHGCSQLWTSRQLAPRLLRLGVLPHADARMARVEVAASAVQPYLRGQFMKGPLPSWSLASRHRRQSLLA